MSQKLFPFKLICFVVLAGTAIAAFFTFKASPVNTVAIAPTASNATFNNSYCNAVFTDTFIHLIQNAYPSFATTTINNSILKVQINGANALAQDFYNGNDNLLQYTLQDFGFDIKYLANTKSIVAQFTISNNGVQVPNDVLLRLAQKNYAK
jgi:hypothetical protein